MEIAIIADLHIDDFRSYNIDHPKYRLHQFLNLAHWISDLSPDALIIPGDFYNTAIMPPEVMRIGLNFFRIVNVPSYVTHGQHDVVVRNTTERDIFYDNTYLSIANEFAQVYYLHREHVEIGGLDFYFQGWEMDYTVEEECDILIGHINVLNSQVGSSEYRLKNGAVIDTDKFELAFIGDIHRHQVLEDKIVVPGTPLQNSFSDYPNPGIILFDTETEEWSHEPTPDVLYNGVRRLHFVKTCNEPEDPDPYILTKVQRETSETKEIKPVRDVDPLEMLDSEVSNQGLDKIHKTIMAKVKIPESTIPNLRFKLKKMKIENFLTIDKLEVNFEDIAQVALLVGSNGSGKSNFLKSLCFAIEGHARPNDFISWNGSGEMRTSLEFEYDGHNYLLERGAGESSFTKLEIDSDPQDKGGYKKINEFIAEEINFLDYLKIMIFDQERTGFLNSYNFGARVDLVTKLFGLNALEPIYKQASDIQSEWASDLSTSEADISKHEAVITSLDEVIANSVTSDQDELKRELVDLLGRRKSVDQILETAQKNAAELDIAATSYNRDKSRYLREISSRKENLKKLEEDLCFTCGQVIGGVKLREIRESTRSNIQYYEQCISELVYPDTEKLEKFKVLKKKSEQKRNEIQAEIDKINSQIASSKVVEDARNRIGNLQDEIALIDANLVGLRQDISVIEEYIKIIEPKSGTLTLSILQRIATILSNDTFKVDTFKIQKNKKVVPDFTVSLNLGDRWVKYDNLSGGQKSIVDLYVLSKLFEIVGGTGLLILDETLKFLDSTNTELAVSIVQELDVENCIIASHAIGFPYYDKLVTATIHKGISQYNIS